MAINMSLVYNQKMSSEDGASEMMTVEREDAPQWRKNVAALTDRSMLKYYIVALLGASWFFFEIVRMVKDRRSSIRWRWR